MLNDKQKEGSNGLNFTRMRFRPLLLYQTVLTLPYKFFIFKGGLEERPLLVATTFIYICFSLKKRRFKRVTGALQMPNVREPFFTLKSGNDTIKIFLVFHSFAPKRFFACSFKLIQFISWLLLEHSSLGLISQSLSRCSINVRSLLAITYFYSPSVHTTNKGAQQNG